MLFELDAEEDSERQKVGRGADQDANGRVSICFTFLVTATTCLRQDQEPSHRL